MISKIKLATVGVLSSITMLSVLPATVSAHSYEHHEKHNYTQQNIVEKAVAINKESGEFSTLIAAVSCTNLINRLQNENREFTVFAPTDAAFAKLGLNASNICSSFDRHTLTGILKYHISRGSMDAEDVLSQESLTMLNREEAIISGATIAGQNIIMTDVEASNGIMHVIDGVMLP
jgi:uncharacterized surface protein with fasciclin (FAS1) repeats